MPAQSKHRRYPGPTSKATRLLRLDFETACVVRLLEDYMSCSLQATGLRWITYIDYWHINISYLLSRLRFKHLMSVLTLFCLLLRVPSIQQIENVSLIGSPSVGWVRGPPEKKSVNPAQGFNSLFFFFQVHWLQLSAQQTEQMAFYMFHFLVASMCLSA